MAFETTSPRSAAFLAGSAAFLAGSAAFLAGSAAFLAGSAAFLGGGRAAFLASSAALPAGRTAFLARGAAFVTSTAVAVTLAWCLVAAGSAMAASAGPQVAMTGAPAIAAEPAEDTCTSCHNSFPINPDDAGALELEGVPEVYEAGQTYALTLRLSHTDPSVQRWGFQLTAVELHSGGGAGSFVVTDPMTTQVLESMVGTRTYMNHAPGGTAMGQTGGMSWSFEWKAPESELGPVAFFAAANASNLDGSNQGDRVYSRSPQPIARSQPAKD